MKKTFINPEMEVLRFQKGADVLLTSIQVSSSNNPADYHPSLSRGKYDDDDDF